MQHSNKAFLILILLIVVVIVTDYIFNFSNCMSNSYKEKFRTFDSLRDLKQTKKNSDIRNNDLLKKETIKLNNTIVSRCYYDNENFISLKPINNHDKNIYNIDSSIHLNISKEIAEMDFSIKYITDYSNASKLMPILNCDKIKFPFYLLVSSNHLTVFNSNNTLALVKLKTLNSVNNIAFDKLVFSKSKEQPIIKVDDNPKKIELSLTTGGKNVKVNFNIDSSAYDKLKQISDIQRIDLEDIPIFPVKNDCY